MPLYGSNIQAGFPSPADDYIEDKIDLNKQLIKNPSATYFVKVSGDSMLDANIREGDILVVDKSLKPINNRIVIAAVDGELTVKRLKKVGHKVALVAENNKYSEIKMTNQELIIWGVVTYIIHKA